MAVAYFFLLFFVLSLLPFALAFAVDFPAVFLAGASPKTLSQPLTNFFEAPVWTVYPVIVCLCLKLMSLILPCNLGCRVLRHSSSLEAHGCVQQSFVWASDTVSRPAAAPCRRQLSLPVAMSASEAMPITAFTARARRRIPSSMPSIDCTPKLSRISQRGL